MPKTSVILLLCSILSLTLALSPTLDKNYFYVPADNRLSQDLFQTRNGIIAHSIESINGTLISRYTLLDIISKDASPILNDIVSACEIADPVFQHLHYHVQTDSLVYFCPKNTSLLIIDQSSLTTQTSIPFTLSGSWPTARLSTDGQNVAILGLDTPYSTNPQSSMLVKVNMQTKQVATQILFNQGLASNESVVAFASSKKAAYVATNKINGTTVKFLTTTIYSLVTIGNTYQLTPVTNFSTLVTYKTITKLFTLGKYVVTNNFQDLYFINQQGSITQKGQLCIKYVGAYSSDALFQVAMTSQSDGTYLYTLSTFSSVDRYSILESAIIVKSLSKSIRDVQIAYGNQTSGDLMFTSDFDQINFNIVDLQSLKTVYSAIIGYDNLMLTDTTYAIIKSIYNQNENFYVHIFDLKTDALISTQKISRNYHYNKNQHIISSLNATVFPGCWIEHVDLVTGKYWTTLNFTGDSNPICNSWIADLNMTEKGNPEVVFPFADHYLIITETYGQLTFKTLSSAPVNWDHLNINFDTLFIYYVVAYPEALQDVTYAYSFNSQSQKFELRGASVSNYKIKNQGLFTVNTEMFVALSNTSFTLVEELHAPNTYNVQNDWNFASSFQDSNGTYYVIATYAYIDYFSTKGSSIPQLFATSGSDFAVSLPGLRSVTIRAQSAGPQSYWTFDDLSSAFGLVRFYNAGKSSASNAQKTLISM